MDSAHTAHQLDNIISGWYIDEYYDDISNILGLKGDNDVALLPYYYQIFCNNALPYEVINRFSYNLSMICSQYDKNLMYLYDRTVARAEEKNGHLFSDCKPYYLLCDDINRVRSTIPDYLNYADIDGERMSVDSLRIRVVAYNDRNALGKLERYYHDRNEPRELAIYYRVLLNYDGNGDLAERFYYVLRPYLKEKAQYLNGIREVLLRTALCDHNERAQELCDSLGFSLCDYKIPVPCHDGDDPNREFISGYVGDVDFFEEDTPDDYDDVFDDD